MKKNRAIVVLLLTAIITVFLCYTAGVGIGPTGTGSATNIKTGLDLSGGVSITYQAKDSNPSAEDMSDTVYKLQKRVEQYSTEAQVYKEGNDRIAVEIPGVTDADEILNDLGKPGSLCFITMTDDDGNANFSSTGSGYVLARSLDEIRESGSVVLEGTDVKDAQGGAFQSDKNSSREYAVSLTLTDEGKTKFADATEANVGKQIAIVYDNQILSAPKVNEAITGGQAQITGMSSVEEAQNLASYIRIGSLSIELEELRSSVVAAQLGEEAISTSVMAGLIGLVIVIIFMIIMYRLPGVVAGVALILYTAIVLITLNAFDITLTLPGIAGIILGIGMAVDANVIIYARIQEEIAAGNSVRASIKSGFSKAFSAIFDGNITTLIASLVLMWLGSGTVKGFAYTLALGIVVSMFTALVVSRFVMNALYAVGFHDEKFYGRAKQRKIFNIVGKRKVFFIISIVLILSGPVAMLIHHNVDGTALNYALDFSGGTATDTTYTIGSGNFISDLDKGLVGLTVGQEYDIPCTFPDNYTSDLAGKSVIFTVKVTAIQKTTYPEITDEWVVNNKESLNLSGDTVADFREEVRKIVEANANDTYLNNTFTSAYQIISENIGDVNYPQDEIDSLVEVLNTNIESEFNTYGSYYGISDLDTYKKSVYGFDSIDAFNEYATSSAQQYLLQKMIVTIIAADNDIHVSEDEINSYGNDLAQYYGYDDFNAIVDAVGSEVVSEIGYEILYQKVVEFECSQITEVEQ